MSEQARPSLAEIDRIDTRAQHKIAEIRHLLIPNLRGLVKTPVTKAEGPGRIRVAPEDDRDLVMLKVSLAFADLADLQESLQQYRDLIIGEMRRHHCGRSAAAAYTQSLQHAKIRHQH